MKTQKFMGRGQLVNRLTAQVGSRGLAIELLKKRGHLKDDGRTLTEDGKRRNAMTASERAKDRASKRTGLPASEFVYDRRTNVARKK